MTAARPALGRSYRAERALAAVVGLVALVAGGGAFALGQGWLGAGRSGGSVVDPVVTRWLSAHADAARGVAIGVGVLLLVLGLLWFARTLKLERRPDLALDDTDGAGITVTAGAIANAVAADAEGIRGVSKARVRPVGRPDSFGLRINLVLDEGTELGAVWRELDAEVLRRARETLGVSALPAAVRLELDTSAGSRVR